MPNLLFVDATPKAARSTEERELELSRVRSYAAAVAHRERKARNPKSKDAETSKPLVNHRLPLSLPHGRTHAFGSSALPRSDPNVVPAHLRSRSPSSIDSTSSSEQEDTENDIIIYDQTIVSRAQLESLIPSDFSCYRGMRTDPFGYISKRSFDAIDYFAQLMAPHHAPVYKIFNVTNIFTQFLFELLQHEDYFYAGATSTLISMHNSWRPGQILPPKVLEYLKIAISKLRQRLTRSNGVADVLTIMAVQALAITAGATGDLASHEIHKKSLVPLVNSCGGIDALGHDGHARNLLMHWEACWALYSDSALFPTARPKHVPYYPPFPFQPDIRALVLKLPLGFEGLAQKRKLSLPTLELLGRMADASDQLLREGSIIRDERENFQGSPRRYKDFWEACPCLSVPDSHEDQPNLEKLIVLALTLYCMHTFSPVQVISATYAGVRLNLYSNIVRKRPADEIEADVIVWIWMNVIDAWRNTDDTLLPQGLELSRALKPRFRFVHNVDQMLMRVRLFFTNEKFEQRCRTHWNAVPDIEGGIGKGNSK